MPSSYIEIDDYKIVESKEIQYKISCSPDIRKYMNKDSFSVKYSQDIDDAPPQILVLPALGGLAPVAWILGADLKVPVIDHVYLDSLTSVAQVQKIFFPKFPFSNIIPEKIVKEQYAGTGSSLLFSGGLDSTYTYTKYQHEKPTLFHLYGSDIPIYNKKYMKKTWIEYIEFAKNEQVEIVFIESNLRNMYKESQISRENGESLGYIPLWEKFSLSLALSGMIAPYTPGRINKLHIASSHSPEFSPTEIGYGSHPLVDNKIRWGDFTVSHVDEDVDRPSKVKYIKENYIDVYQKTPSIRVCTRAPKYTNQLNCGVCEKCRRTIVNFLLHEIDPKNCGFPLEARFLETIKKDFINGSLIKDAFKINYWKSIQKSIPKNNGNYLNSKEFFDWFKDFQIPDITPDDTHSKTRDMLLRFQSVIPTGLRDRFKALYNRYTR